MKTAFRFFLVSLIMVLPFLVQPVLAIYFEHDPDDPAEYAPIKEGEKPVIPLDTKDPGYNIWQKTRDDLMKGREPGLINIQRFPGGPGWAGIPTFFKLPIALTPEDLKAGDVDVAIIGAHTDMGGGYRGAAWGPLAFRAFDVHCAIHQSAAGIAAAKPNSPPLGQSVSPCEGDTSCN